MAGTGAPKSRNRQVRAQEQAQMKMPMGRADSLNTIIFRSTVFMHHSSKFLITLPLEVFDPEISV
jgi:hypothetical protein